MKFSIHFEFYRERQVYYHMMPVIWKPHWLSRGFMFEFLRYRAIVWTEKGDAPHKQEKE